MVPDGYSSIMEGLARGLHVRLGAVVKEVAYGGAAGGGGQGAAEKSPGSGEAPRVRVTLADGETFDGDAVVVTVPLGCLKVRSVRVQRGGEERERGVGERVQGLKATRWW